MEVEAPLQHRCSSTVNIGKPLEEMRFLMTTIVFEYATPEAQTRFNEYKPTTSHHPDALG